MNDELWTSAKHIAQTDGRRDDWVYVMDVYKSMGGSKVALVIFSGGERHQILGEANENMVLTQNSLGELSLVEKSLYKRSKKKFHKQDNSKATVMKKSIVKDGQTYTAVVYKNAKFL